MSRRLFENEIAISNLIATLILIAVAVVGGGFAYTAFRNQASSTTTMADIQVQSLNIVKPTGAANAHASMTVKNNGTQRLDSVKADIKASGSYELEVTTGIDPGATVSANAELTALTLNAGETCVVVIEAEITNGDTVTKTMTVRVQS